MRPSILIRRTAAPFSFWEGRVECLPNWPQEVDRRLRDFVERYPENAATNYFYALGMWERGGGDQGKDLVKIERLLRKAEDPVAGLV